MVVHGDVAGTEGVRRALCDWMGFVDAGKMACLDRYIGYYHPYATSHDEPSWNCMRKYETWRGQWSMRGKNGVRAICPYLMPHYARRDRNNENG